MKKNSKNRPPAFQFYPKDWLYDSNLRICTLEAKGFWIELMCHMHESVDYGYLMYGETYAVTPQDIYRVTGVHTNRVTKLVTELVTKGVLRRDEKGYYSKRMVEDQRIRVIRSEVGKLGGNPDLVKQTGKQKPTPSSSSSSSSSKRESEKRKFTPPSLEEFVKYFQDNEYPKDLAIRAWKGYDAADWHDSKGNPIRNWKQKCQHVWFKSEHKIDGKSQSSPSLQPRILQPL